MKRILIAVAGLLMSGAALAAGGHELPYRYTPDTNNLGSVQRGARNFMSYCSGCHSMKYLRYNRMGTDLQLSEEVLKSELMFTSDKLGDHIISSMPANESKAWFGQTPPDLTLETRYRGPDWVYSYLMTFYIDSSRPLGVNNLVLPGVSMPHVLGALQGYQVKPEVSEGHAAADAEHHGSGLSLSIKGALSPEQYEAFVADTVNFMAYAAEPGKAKRIEVGFRAMVYLVVLFVLAYFLKKEFWRDVH
jgi:ubiquinol-cytochrome c reductase cytochrome c1 subunit